MESGSSQESSLDFTFAFNNAQFSDRTLHLKIMPDSNPDPIDSLDDPALTRSRKRRFRNEDANVHEAVQSNDNQSSTDDPETQVKHIRVNTAILAAKSPFFYKLFSNGMSESSEQHVNLEIQESEEAAFMDLLKFMYTNKLSSTTPFDLLDVLIAADRYEVESCMKYCLRLSQKSPMTCESAALCLDLPPTILMDSRVRSLTYAAKEFLVARFKDISKFQEEMLDLPLDAMETVLSDDGLEVDSEDIIYDFVMKWAHRHYTKQSERQDILNTRLLRLIRLQYMSWDKLKELQSCNNINPKCSSELLLEALAFQMSPVSTKKERAYKLRPVKVIRFDSPHNECVVYLDLKREECACLLPDGWIYSRDFHFGGKAFYLMGKRYRDDKNSSGHSFGLYLGMREKGSIVEYEFATRTKPSEEFVPNNKKFESKFTTDSSTYGKHNLFGVSWDRFIVLTLLTEFFISGLSSNSRKNSYNLCNDSE